MLEDLFSGLLEGLVEFVIEVVFEGLGEILSGIADCLPESWGRGDESRAVEKYKFLPKDLDK
jgi:hypothetical protein